MIEIGDYIIYDDNINFLGEGAYSKVYKSIYNGLSTKYINNGTYVATKIINTSKLTPKALIILEDEIYIMNIIKENPHINIVECYDIIKTIDHTYIFLELCEFGDLRTILKNPIKEVYAKYYFIQLARGLKYLDNQNITHRDIKPRNILLTNNRKTLKIADFGFAIKGNKNDMYETVCGSPLYMAPEITRKNTYNNQTDLWSVGLILYEMIYGEHPYGSCKNIKELEDTIDNKSIKIPPTKNTNKNISDDCIYLLQKLLKKDVNSRITWEDFFNHKWLEDDLDNSINKKVNSITNEDIKNKNNYYESLDCKYNSYDIIDDYYGETQDDIFDMEFSTNK